MKKTRFIAIILAVILLFRIIPIDVNASQAPLDEIQEYTMKVNMRPDGTMDIRYHVKWKVLDSTSEGPLTWVKIGNPNKHVDEIVALSDNINKISYMSDNGSFIRIDFDRAYYAGEIIEFDYTIHQSYMYVIEKDGHICRYSFTPGWFEEIEVKNITIMWKDNNVIESTAQKHENGYLIWTAELAMGERLNASVKYNLDAFTTNEDEQYTEESETSSFGKKVAIVIAVLIVIIIIIIIICALSDDDDGYSSHSGFSGGSRTTYIHTSSCVRSSCACVNSCACACACAGGGRAGCSKKDFYGTNVRTERLSEILEEEKNNC